MAHLLGSQDCIDNLRRDLTDLQGVVLDVFSRTGPIRFSSWKFPDKMSCNLDLVSLLEKYDFVEGEQEFSQHSHVVLLELVIDRLVLLLQSLNAHVELNLGVRQNGARSQPVTPSVSIGVVAKHYWNHMVQLGHLILHLKKGTCKEADRELSTKQVGVQMMHTNGKNSARSTPSQRPTSSTSQMNSTPSQRPASSTSQMSSTPSQRPASSTSQMNSTPRPASSTSQMNSTPRPTPSVPQTPSLHSISTDTRSVGCQTVTSSLVPCDVCARVQHSLRLTSDALVRMCQSQGLPSSLAHFLEEVDGTLEHGRLSAPDVAQWAAEQSRDIGRMGKHLAQLKDTVQPMKDSLAALEGECEKLRGQLQRAEKLLAQERENRRASIEELEARLQKTQARREEAVRRLEAEVEELRQGILSLEEKNSKLKAQLSLQQDDLHNVESDRAKLQREARARLEELAELEGHSRALQAELSGQQLLLDKECAKYESACRQQQATQAKQKGLLERVDALDRECEELQERLAQSEDGRAELQEQLGCCREEKERLQACLTQQQAVSAELQKKMRGLEAQDAELQGMVQELTQRERLLVAFPELSPASQGRPQSTGNILEDMEQQLRANSIRITVLEQENATLSGSLAKLREVTQHKNFKVDLPDNLDSHCPIKASVDKRGYSHSTESLSHSQGSAGGRSQSHQGAKLSDRSESGADSVWSCERRPLTPSSHTLNTLPATLHQQTLSLCPTEDEPARTYARIRDAARTRSGGTRHRRK